MLSIGEFSKICKVSTKTLRYYAEIELILPIKVNNLNGYRYYSIEQLETMLFIKRLKSHGFSLEKIKEILTYDKSNDELLYTEFIKKKEEMLQQREKLQKDLNELDNDIHNLMKGKSLMSYLENIDVQFIEVTTMNLLFVRKKIVEADIAMEYNACFSKLFQRIEDDNLTVLAPPMVLFHSSEFTPLGLDMEFAIPIKESVHNTRKFNPGLCLKTVLYGSYNELSSVYAKQRIVSEKEGYVSSDALFEIYVVDSSQVLNENEIVTEIYYPVKKVKFKEE